jgi:ubiquinone/menaquinone biosynthesis C-methylase UbiE
VRRARVAFPDSLPGGERISSACRRTLDAETSLFEYPSLFDRRGAPYSRANRLYPEARSAEAAALLSHLAPSPGTLWRDVSAGGGCFSDRARATGLPPARFVCDGSLPFLRSGGTSARGCVAAADRLPVPAGRFGAVSCLAALHHAEDRRAAGRELLRVTSAGGRAARCDVADGSDGPDGFRIPWTMQFVSVSRA